jgi:hypothetical protein
VNRTDVTDVNRPACHPCNRILPDTSDQDAPIPLFTIGRFPHWQKVEAGEVNVTLATLVKIADVLEVPVPELLGG